MSHLRTAGAATDSPSFLAAWDFLGAANGDDPYGRRLLEEAPEYLRGFSMAAEDTFARVSRWSTSLKGTEMRVEMRGLSPLDLMSPLSGEFNVWNAYSQPVPFLIWLKASLKSICSITMCIAVPFAAA